MELGDEHQTAANGSNGGRGPGLERSLGGATGERPWQLVAGAIGLLLVAIAAVGVVAIAANERASAIITEAIASDLEIEDEGDDLRAAVLDLRHFHRNLVFGVPTDQGRAELEAGYQNLTKEITELAEIGSDRLAERGIVQPDELLRMAEQYYAGFQPAIDLMQTDPDAFNLASDEGLDRLQVLDVAAVEVDDIGEVLAEESLDEIERAAVTERFLLSAVVGGVVLAGLALATATSRVLTRLRVSYGREQDATRELSRALRTKNDFIADASHELRTPLTVIRGNADIGLDTPGQPIHREVLEEISTEATRMGRLVEDLLFLARSDASGAPLERDVVPTRRLLQTLVKPAEMLAQQHGAHLVPEFNADGLLDIDPARIEQAVLILVDNAGKHSPPGGRVTLAARARHGQLAISVGNEGSGIPADELPMIFDRFYQIGKRRTRKQGGAGLGLSIARSIIEGHGGSIGVVSSPDRGTRMTILLPVVGPPEPAPPPTPARFAPSRSSVAGTQAPAPSPSGSPSRR